MSTWSPNLLDSDGMQSALHDLLESPNPHDVVREAATLANSELGDLDEDECYGVLASALVVDHLIYNTPVDGHAAGISRLDQEHGATEFTDLRGDLARALQRVLQPGSAAYDELEALGEKALKKWRKPLDKMQARLAGAYHGKQDVKPAGD